MEDKYDFPLKGTVTVEQIKEVQRRLLEIAKSVRDCFEKNNIPYTIIFGTLLGSVRHKGFIPWDLDFDLAVPEEYYDKAAALLPDYIPDWCLCLTSDTDPNYCAFWLKVMDKNSDLHSTAYQSDNNWRYRGCHVDVYKLIRTSAETYERDVLEQNKSYFKLKYRRGLMGENDFKAQMSAIESSIKKWEDTSGHGDSVKNRYCFLRFLNTPENVIFPTRKYVYEGEWFDGPADYDAMLKDTSYKGDYMTPPPYEKRDIRVDSVKFL